MGKGRARANPISAVEAAYDVESEERPWLEGLRAAVDAELGRGLGSGAYVYDASGLPIRTGTAVGSGLFPTETLSELVSSATEEYVAATWRAISFGMASQGPGYDDLPAVRDILAPRGIADFVTLNAYDPSGVGVWAGAGLPAKATPTSAEVRRWSRVAAHIAAAYRLRTRARVTSAVLTPAGRVEHAEGEAATKEARATLRDAAIAMDRARGALRRTDPDGALELWRALAGGRWSLVDSFERDGKRYVVAVENAVRAPGPDSLAGREREVVALLASGYTTKLAAYELGLSDSTVRVLLARAARKVGVETRAELIALFRAHARARPS